MSPDLQAEYDRIIAYMRDVRIPAIVQHLNRSYGQRLRRMRELRQRAIRAGMPLLTVEQINEEYPGG